MTVIIKLFLANKAHFLRTSWASSIEAGSAGASSFVHKALSLLRSWSVSTIPTLNQNTPPGKLFRVTAASLTDSAARTLLPEPGIPCRVRNWPGDSSERPCLMASSWK